MGRESALRELLEVATRCTSAGEFRRTAVDWLAREVGADAMFFARIDGEDTEPPGVTGLTEPWLRTLRVRLPRYGSDLHAITERSIATGGFLRGDDVDLATWAARPGRCGFEEEMVFPVGLHRGTAAALMVRGVPAALLLVGRARASRPFDADDLDRLDLARPILALGEAVHAPAPQPSPPPVPAATLRGRRRTALTRGERNILEFLVLGLTNAQIAAATELSPHTVRNHLTALFQKLEVASRAELVGIALSEGLVARRAA